jgi:hypothetical protein
MKMRRREFIAGLGSAVALPLAARAQQPAMPVIGYLSSLAAEGAQKSISPHSGESLASRATSKGKMSRFWSAMRCKAIASQDWQPTLSAVGPSSLQR